jgi:hypothetical protein
LLAGVAASWFFGNNPASQVMYDVTTGRTYDGVTGDGVVNFNSGAESTIHGLLAMLALDRAPDVAAMARIAQVDERRTWTMVEAESGQLGSGAQIERPASAWTGESLWSGGAGVRLTPSGTLTLGIPATGPNLLMPVVLLDPSAGETVWTVPHRTAGTIDHADVGDQGDSPAPGLLSVETLPQTVRDEDTLTVRGREADSLVDAVLVQPEVEHVVLTNGASSTALVRNFANRRRTVVLNLPAGTTATVTSFDAQGRIVRESDGPAHAIEVEVRPGGFAIVRT